MKVAEWSIVEGWSSRTETSRRFVTTVLGVPVVKMEFRLNKNILRIIGFLLQSHTRRSWSRSIRHAKLSFSQRFVGGRSESSASFYALRAQHAAECSSPRSPSSASSSAAKAPKEEVGCCQSTLPCGHRRIPRHSRMIRRSTILPRLRGSFRTLPRTVAWTQ